ncbi:amidohydrolase family protein [Limobrevibacterium gyesilva]|uniref:Amidohydrolase family protein n=1 Tax=Limobrevibacterium gyesilva TaxID=2991712 RepID=A0AA42CJQ3_9PROT|nr:amidohydrolase family protein [Limobrevibacterium gyesilva]MCW3477095.1 amidohydrolase family protein [Limobrevibacterium gyesilva]
MAEPRDCDLIIRNGLVVTMDPERTVWQQGAVAVAGTAIVAVGPTTEILSHWRAPSVLDAGGAPVHPGFIDAHYHVPNHLTRGVFPEAAVSSNYFASYALWYDRMDEEDEHAAGLCAGLEMLRSGVTCFMEPGTVFATAAVAASAEAVGIRASLCEPFLSDAGYNDTLSRMRRVLPDTARCLRTLGQELWRNRDDTALVRGHVGLFGSGSASDELTRSASALAKEEGAVFTQHQNTRVSEVQAQEAMVGGTHPLLHLAELGALGPHCSFTHMNLIRDDEAPVVLDSGMSVIWCAAASMNWGFGGTGRRRPHADFHRAGVPVALGVDVPKFGHDTGPLAAYLLSRDHGDSAPLGIEDIFEMATLRGARAVGMADRIGSLEPGKRADIVIRTMADASAQPGWSPLQNILLASRSRSIDTVLVDGRIVLRHGCSTVLDEAAVYDRARQRVTRLAAAVGLAPASTWPVRSQRAC